MPQSSNPSDRLVSEHLELARSLVQRFVRTGPRNLDRDALESDAMLGLLYAARKFDPSRGASFTTYAQRRIIGTMIDGLRTRTGGRGRYRTLRRMLSLSMVLHQGEGRDVILEDTLAGQEEPVETQLEREDEVQWLMSELKPSSGLMVRQFYYQELSQQRIGQIHGVTAATISHRLNAARGEMRQKACCGRDD